MGYSRIKNLLNSNMNIKQSSALLLLFLGLSPFILSSCQESIEDRCLREALEFTKRRCPVPVDNYTTLDSISFDKKTLTRKCFYTLKGIGDDPKMLARSNPKGLLLRQLRNTTALRIYMDAGFNFEYTYFSESHKGEILFHAIFSPDDYRRNP